MNRMSRMSGMNSMSRMSRITRMGWMRRIFKKNVRIVRFFSRKLYGLYGFFFENCMDFCTDFFKNVLATLKFVLLVLF